MINKYLLNGIPVIDLVKEKSQKGHAYNVLILQDGNKVPACGQLLTRVCPECGATAIKKFSSQMDKTRWLCFSCLHKGERNPFFGKKHSQEFKDRLSNERKGTWGVGKTNGMYGESIFDHMTKEAEDEWRRKHREQGESMCGENNHMYGKTIFDFMTEDEIAKWKENNAKAKEAFLNDPVKRKMKSDRCKAGQQHRKELDPEYYKEIKARGGRATTSNPARYMKNDLEMKVESWLKEHGLDYEYGAIMGDGKYNYQFDFIIRHRRILIEVQGDYWHANPLVFNEDGSDGKKKWNAIQKKDLERDKRKLEFALSHNFTLLYIWESDINNGDFSALHDLLNLPPL